MNQRIVTLILGACLLCGGTFQAQAGTELESCLIVAHQGRALAQSRDLGIPLREAVVLLHHADMAQYPILRGTATLARLQASSLELAVAIYLSDVSPEFYLTTFLTECRREKREARQATARKPAPPAPSTGLVVTRTADGKLRFTAAPRPAGPTTRY